MDKYGSIQHLDTAIRKVLDRAKHIKLHTLTVLCKQLDKNLNVSNTAEMYSNFVYVPR